MKFEIYNKCFKGFGLKGWQDSFKIDFSEIPKDYVEISKTFYEQNGATFLESSDHLQFKRGNLFWSIFNLGPEKLPKQNIDLNFQVEGEKLRAEITYDVCCYCVLRFPPFGLKKEVELLTKALSDKEKSQI